MPTTHQATSRSTRTTREDRRIAQVTAALLGGDTSLVQRRTVCTVGHAINPYANGGQAWTYWHRWKRGNKCLNCGKTRKETLEWTTLRSA